MGPFDSLKFEKNIRLLGIEWIFKRWPAAGHLDTAEFKIVTPGSWHRTYQAWYLLLAGNILLSSGVTQWRSFYPFCLKICGFVLLIRHIIPWIWAVRFPKFVKTIVLPWKPWPAVDLKISKCHILGSRSLSWASSTRQTCYLYSSSGSLGGC